jgi:tetratricopeptide (TPR) repeat protein
MFAAPFTRGAAAQVADARLPVLAALADKSLLRAHGDGRFSLHRLMQQCAKAKLVDASGVRRRHSEYFMRLLARIPLAEIGVARTLEEIDGAFEDCRMAWRYGVETRAASALEQMLPTLLRFCEIRRRHIEGIALFGAAAQELGDTAPLGTRALVQRALGSLHYRNGELASASEAIRTAMRLYRSLRDQRSLVQCLTILGMIAWTRGEIVIAQRHFGAAMRRARAAGDDTTCATALNALANCARSLGRFDPAIKLQQEALRLHEGTGNVTGQAVVLNDMGAMLRTLGRCNEAEDKLRRGAELCEAHHLAVIREYCLYNLAMTQIELGQLQSARSNLQQAMKADQAAGSGLLSALLRLCSARIHMRSGDAAAVPALLQEALALARSLASVPVQLFALGFVAEWLNGRAERDRAASLWRFLADHPRNEAGDRAAARRALELLALAPGEARRVRNGARGLEIDLLVETLITELGSWGREEPGLPAGATAGPTLSQRRPG